jgi:hypothetical protein
VDEADPRAKLERDAPGFAQRGSAKLSADGSTPGATASVL